MENAATHICYYTHLLNLYGENMSTEFSVIKPHN